MDAGSLLDRASADFVMADLYRKKVGELQTLLMTTESRTRAMELIPSLIERIEVIPGKKRGNPDVNLVGALAQILTFDQTKTLPQPRWKLTVGSWWLRGHAISVKAGDQSRRRADHH